MGSEQTEPQGPDVSMGVELNGLPEGEPFLGHVGGEAVLLVRREGEVLAIGATCTHYGGPLAEGLVVGDTVRCPWHHACFSLRTGEAIRAPALNPVARWVVELRNGRAYVLGKEEADPLSPLGRSAEGPASVVIIGAGAAGSAAAEMLRRRGYDGSISLVDPDPSAPYDRPNLSKDYLAGEAPEEWIPLRPDGFYPDHGIDQISAAADAIDLHGRTVRLSDGRSLPFGALLIATGAGPVRLTVPGSHLPHVFTLRSLSDSRVIIAAAEHARRAVVLGASFIGMEVAASLRARGLEVTVVAPEGVPFERTLGAALGGLLRQEHERHGVEFRLARTAAAIDSSSVRLDDDAVLPADLVVVGIGVRPETRLAEEAGLRVENGVIVNEYLETDTPGVFAAGDIASYPAPFGGERIRVEHWVAAQRQGQAAARNVLGERTPFSDPPFFWTRQWDVSIRYVGHAGTWEAVRIDGDLSKHDAAISYLRGDEVRAVATVGRDLESLHSEAALEAAARDRLDRSKA